MSEIMKPTVIGSKFITFDNGAGLDDKLFPADGSHPYIIRNGDKIPISILQVQQTSYDNKVRYLVEYIELQ